MGNIHSIRKFIKKITPRPLKVVDEYDKGELLFDSYWLRNRKMFIGVKTFILLTITIYYCMYANTEKFGQEPTILDSIRDTWKNIQKHTITMDYSDARIQSKLRKDSDRADGSGGTSNGRTNAK